MVCARKLPDTKQTLTTAETKATATAQQTITTAALHTQQQQQEQQIVQRSNACKTVRLRPLTKPSWESASARNHETFLLTEIKKGKRALTSRRALTVARGPEKRLQRRMNQARKIMKKNEYFYKRQSFTAAARFEEA